MWPSNSSTFCQIAAKASRFIRPATAPHALRLRLFFTVTLLLYAAMLLALATLWYGKDTSVAFHWFDDSKEWRLCDKLGHAYVAFAECRIIMGLLQWCGITDHRKLYYSFILAFMFQSGYEVLDGFALGYGASAYDLAANAVGASIVIVQYLVFKKILVDFKFNVALTSYAALRPSLLGDSLLARCIKDYNGHTYWLSFHINELFKVPYFPKWFMLSIGYGGDGLIGGHDNTWVDKNGLPQDCSQIHRASRYYLSFDINLLSLKGPKWLCTIAQVLNYVKLPLPGIEIHTEKGIKWRWFCY